jgi:hypothetical protein
MTANPWCHLSDAGLAEVLHRFAAKPDEFTAAERRMIARNAAERLAVTGRGSSDVPLDSIEHGRHLVELWDNVGVDPKRPFRITFKSRVSGDTPWQLDSSHLYRTRDDAIAVMTRVRRSNRPRPLSAVTTTRSRKP